MGCILRRGNQTNIPPPGGLLLALEGVIKLQIGSPVPSYIQWTYIFQWVPPSKTCELRHSNQITIRPLGGLILVAEEVIKLQTSSRVELHPMNLPFPVSPTL